MKIERTPHSQDDNEVMTVLNYSGRPIRMYYLDNMIWWVLTDICGLIGLGNPSKAADSLDDYEKMTRTISNSHSRQRGGAQKLILINESGLYHLLLTSRKPEVQSFRRWVTAEVIPSVRKNGGYIIGQETMEPDKLVTAAGQVTRNILTTRNPQLQDLLLENADQAALIREYEPKVVKWVSILQKFFLGQNSVMWWSCDSNWVLDLGESLGNFGRRD